jgi:hypothetical protein
LFLGVKTLYILFRSIGGQTENFTPGDNFTPRGQNLPLGTTSPLGAKLRMGLWLVKLVRSQFLGPGVAYIVASSPPDTKETGAVGSEIEYR